MIPLLITGAVVGLGAHARASIDNDEAKEKNKRANEIIDEANRVAQDAKKLCQGSIDVLAKEKTNVLQGNMRRFVKSFSQIKAVNFSETGDLFEMAKFNKSELTTMQSMVNSVQKVSTNDIVGGVSGTALAVGAVDIITGGSLLGSAGISVGGLAGGAALGAVAAPIFAITGIFSASEASANLEKAKSNLAKAKTYQNECETYAYLAKAVSERCDLFYETLVEVNEVWFTDAVNQLEMLVNSKKTFGNFFKNLTGKKIYTRQEMQTVASVAALAKMVKTIIDTNILDKDGHVTDRSEKVILEIQNKMNSGEPLIKISEPEVQPLVNYQQIKSQVPYQQLQQQDQKNIEQKFQESKEREQEVYAGGSEGFNNDTKVIVYENVERMKGDSAPKTKSPIILFILLSILIIGTFACVVMLENVVRSRQKTETYVALESVDSRSDETINLEKNLEDVSEEMRTQKPQLTDQEISSLFMERESDNQYVYSDIEIEQKEQADTLFTAKVKCVVKSSEGFKNAEYMLLWNWEDERWNFDHIQELELLKFTPLSEPDNNIMTDFIAEKELLLQSDGSKENRIELVGENLINADDEYSYIYQYLQIQSKKLFEIRQKIEAEIKFDGETGYWDYENVLWNYDGDSEKICTMSGIWEGMEYETYEASWKYIIEFLSVNSDDNTTTINSWCEFTTVDGETVRIQVCDEEEVGFIDGEYDIPVGGYIVDHNPSNGMDFTYNFIVEQGKLYINEENEILYLSVQNPKMSISLGIEMISVEKE